jgi:hypothetical protein
MNKGKVSLVFLASVGLCVAIALGLLAVFFPWQRKDNGRAIKPSDPRLSYAGPFRNVDPSVRYVPDGHCADCHRKKAQSYREHPMGRSLWPVEQAPTPPEDSRHNNPFDALGSRFLVGREGDRIWHRRTRLDPDGRPAAEREWDVHYVIGSGARGHSYVTNQDGYLFQTPISWFSQKEKEKWDLSPGFGPALLTGRAVLPECLFCHANRANHVEGSVNRYTEPVFDGHAIGCQRCHGPGELHAQSGDPLDIVNPRRLEPPLRDAVCEQCHLVGQTRIVRRGRELYDFRPGMPLELFWSAFVRSSDAGEGQKAVGQVEQMYQSRCFQGGGDTERLGCISCHDPHEHVPPARRVAHYRERCLTCHQRRGCSLPVEERVRRTAEDSCIDCHMPRYGAADIPHTASTDHRILRGGKAPPRGEKRPAAGDGFSVVSFYRERKGVEEEDERDLAVALVKLTLQGDTASSRIMERILPLLESALRRDPDDLLAGEAKGYALAVQGRSTESLAAFQAVLGKAPDRELALLGAASAAEALGQTEAALGYWRRVVAANPRAPGYRRSLVLLLVKKEAWDEARPECQAWVQLDPLSTEARIARVQCLLAAGDKDEARAEFARIEALAPANLRGLRIRFEKKLR